MKYYDRSTTRLPKGACTRRIRPKNGSDLQGSEQCQGEQREESPDARKDRKEKENGREA